MLYNPKTIDNIIKIHIESLIGVPGGGGGNPGAGGSGAAKTQTQGSNTTTKQNISLLGTILIGRKSIKKN